MDIENAIAPEERVRRTLEVFGGSPHSSRVEWNPELRRLSTTAIAIVPGGCYWARKRMHDGEYRGCSYCNFEPVIDAVTEGVPFRGEDHVSMVANALREVGEGAEKICVFTGGSFAPRDIPLEGLLGMARLVAEHPTAKHMLVESRPELLTTEFLGEIKGVLRPDQVLEVAIGFETQDDRIRNGRPGLGLNKGMSRKMFERGVCAIVESGCIPTAYVMLKPYEGMTEAAGLAECIRTIQYVFSYWIRKVLLQVTFPQESAKELTAAWRAGRWKPARLWSVVQALRECRPLGPIMLGQFDDIPPPLALPENCPECTPAFLRALEEYRQTLSLDAFHALPNCSCRTDWEREVHPIENAA